MKLNVRSEHTLARKRTGRKPPIPANEHLARDVRLWTAEIPLSMTGASATPTSPPRAENGQLGSKPEKRTSLPKRRPPRRTSMTSLATRGVGFHSITEAIGTTTPGGRLVFQLFGALGQFERDLIQERARALPHPRRAAEKADASPWSPVKSLHVLAPSSPKG